MSKREREREEEKKPTIQNRNFQKTKNYSHSLRIPPSTRARATFRSKASGTVAGLAVADAVLREVDKTLKTTWLKSDGDRVVPGEVIGISEGSARSLLVAERVALNFMQRMSGIATATRSMVEAAASKGGTAVVLDTRKTAPGLRVTDKWSVSIGGGTPHRVGLFDMVMVKDNHAAAAGGVAKAADAAAEHLRKSGRLDVPIEVEASSLEEVHEVLRLVSSHGGPGRLSEGKSGITRLMLDNMVVKKAGRERGGKGGSGADGADVSLLRAAVAAVRASGLDVQGLETEASGNVTEETVGTVSATGCSHVSTGALTHSVRALDVSLGLELLLLVEEEGERGVGGRLEATKA